MAFHLSGVPFGGRNLGAHHPAVGFKRELSPDSAWCADHDLGLCRVSQKTHPSEQVDKDGEGSLKKIGIPRSKVCIVDVENCEEGCNKFIQLSMLVVDLDPQQPVPFTYDGINQDVEQPGRERAALGNPTASLKSL